MRCQGNLRHWRGRHSQSVESLEVVQTFWLRGFYPRRSATFRSPSTLDSKDVVAALEAEPSSSSRDLATALGVSSHQTIVNRLHQMEFVHKRPRLDPHGLTRAQSARRMEICQQLLSNPLDDRFWKRIITSDEKWVFLVNHNRQKKWVPRDENLHPFRNWMSLTRRPWSVSGGTSKDCCILSFCHKVVLSTRNCTASS